MRRLLGLTLLASVLVSGCSSSADPDPTAHRAATWTLRYEPGPAVPLGTVVPRVFLAGRTAVFPFTDGEVGPVDALGSVDLRTGKRTVLARSAFPGGAILDAVRVGAETVYVEESARGDQEPGRARWRVVALRAHRVLASSGPHRVATSPELTAIDGTAVWTVAPESGAARAFGWRPGSAVARRDALPGDELECTPSAPDPTLVGGCDERRDWIVWVEHATASDRAGSLFSARVGRAGKRPIGKVRYDLASPVIFGDYVLWDSGDGLRVSSLEHPAASAEVFPARPDNGTTWFAHGNDDAAVLWTQEHGTTTLRVIDADHLHLTRAEP